MGHPQGRIQPALTQRAHELPETPYTRSSRNSPFPIFVKVEMRWHRCATSLYLRRLQLEPQATAT